MHTSPRFRRRWVDRYCSAAPSHRRAPRHAEFACPHQSCAALFPARQDIRQTSPISNRCLRLARRREYLPRLPSIRSKIVRRPASRVRTQRRNCPSPHWSRHASLMAPEWGPMSPGHHNGCEYPPSPASPACRAHQSRARLRPLCQPQKSCRCRLRHRLRGLVCRCRQQQGRP